MNMANGPGAARASEVITFFADPKIRTADGLVSHDLHAAAGLVDAPVDVASG